MFSAAFYLHGLEQEVYRVRLPREFKNQKFGELVHHIYNFKDSGVLVFGVGSWLRSPAEESAGSGGGHGQADTEGPVRFVMHPGEKYAVVESHLFCIARDNPQGLIDASVVSYFRKRAYYQRRKKNGVKVKFLTLRS